MDFSLKTRKAQKHTARITIALVLMMGITVSANAQDSIMSKFNNYRKDVVQEKLFLHTDREVYLTGETMWVKIYNVDASLHTPIDLSKVVYLEIVDRDNQSLVKEKIQVQDGIGTGSVFIPASVNSGNYMLRAYTSWMKNFSPEYFFKKQITVVNSFVQLDATPVAAATANEITFFPEGGNLLVNASNKVGFKVTNKNGSGVEFRGALVDERNDTLLHFKPLRFGMGSFEFTPGAGKKYRAVVRVPGSPAATVALPEVLEEGISMKVTDNGDVLDVEVSFQPAIQNGPNVYMFAHTRQQLAKAERKRILKGKTSFEISKASLKDGVSHITLFDERSVPVAERLYFKVPEKAINITVQSSQPTYKTRAKVTLDIQTDRAVPQMSVSVYRMDSISSAGQEHISDFLYLTSDLKGWVESPGYYFTDDAGAAEAADNLMLTQGWRRFTWNDVFKSNRSFTYAPEFHGHIIRGVVKDLNGQPSPGVVVYASVPGKIVDVYSARSDARGEVSFEMKHFIGGQKVLTYADSVHKVQLLDPFSDGKTSVTLPQFKLSTSVEKNLLARAVGMQVQNIYFEDRYITPRIDSAAFYGNADETYLLDDYTRFTVMEEVMREYVRGVLVRKQRENFKFYNLDLVNKKQFNETPMILLDGVPVFDVNKVMAYDPLKVKKLEVMTRRFYHGYSTFPGIISFSTYNGNLEGFELDSRYVNIDYEGLQMQREFYAPRHEFEKDSEIRLPDQRSLLYWDASLSTDQTRKQNPQFFTSDVPGTYQVVVEGMTTNGAAGFATHIFKVNR